MRDLANNGVYSSTIYVALYVDDILIFCNDQTEYIMVKQTLQKQYSLKDLGPVRNFLNISIQQDSITGAWCFNQAAYINMLLHRHQMEDSNPKRIPIDAGQRIGMVEHGSNNSYVEYEDNCEFMIKNYKSLVGALLYLVGITRPDIT